MDAGAVAAIAPSADTARARLDLGPRAEVAADEGAGVRFDAVLAQERTSAAGGSAPAKSVEALIGTTVSAPSGGCMCDAMAASITAPSVAGPVARPTLPVQATPFSVRAGDVLSIDSGTDGERLHLAIARSALEMLTPGTDGVVRAVPIPWNQVREIRRVL